MTTHLPPIFAVLGGALALTGCNIDLTDDSAGPAMFGTDGDTDARASGEPSVSTGGEALTWGVSDSSDDDASAQLEGSGSTSAAADPDTGTTAPSGTDEPDAASSDSSGSDWSGSTTGFGDSLESSGTGFDATCANLGAFACQLVPGLCSWDPETSTCSPV